jgi:hypothetical protein
MSQDGWPDGFVGRNKDEASDACGPRGIEERKRPADVHMDGIGGMLLHHRDVLVGGGVEDDIGLLGRDQTIHRGSTGDIRQVRAEFPETGVAVSFRFQFALHEIERAFAPVHEDQAPGME